MEQEEEEAWRIGKPQVDGVMDVDAEDAESVSEESEDDNKNDLPEFKELQEPPAFG